MISKHCIHCGIKNIFEITPQFCCGCGEPFNRASAATTHSSTNTEDDFEDEDSGGYDLKKLKQDWSAEYSTEENFEKFGESCGTSSRLSNKATRRAEANLRPSFKADSAIKASREDCRFNGNSKSIGKE